MAVIASGTRRDPTGAGWSGYVTRLEHVAQPIDHDVEANQSAGSSESTSSDETILSVPPRAAAPPAKLVRAAAPIAPAAATIASKKNPLLLTAPIVAMTTGRVNSSSRTIGA